MLLIIVNTVEDHSMSLVRVSADGPESLSFINPDTGDEDFFYSAEDIDWWAHVPMPEQD